MFAIRAQDSGPHPRWSGSYHINDVDPDAAQDLEVFVYNAATGEPELIGKKAAFVSFSRMLASCITVSCTYLCSCPASTHRLNSGRGN